MRKVVRIGTRKSNLALRQTNMVAARLQQQYEGISVEIVPIVTKGDRILDVSLEKIGDKGLFTQELENAILTGRIDMTSPVQRAIRAIKKDLPQLVIVGDVCLCQYTTHGHCGQLCGHYVDNDATLELLCKVAVSQAECGADIIAPSDMMDGRIGAIRGALDGQGFQNTTIM